MIGRRLLLGGCIAASFGTARAGLPISPGDRLAFHIIRHGGTIGEHTVTFSRDGDAMTVSVAADIVIGIGPIALFRYKHRATVQWRGGEVVAIDAVTDHDGTPQQMTARRDDRGLVVQGSKAPQYVAPPNALPGTHWNRAMLDGPFINTEDGRLMRPTVKLMGTERLDVTGGAVEARHYALRGDADLDTYYDLTPSWVGLRFTAKDGSEIRYLRA